MISGLLLAGAVSAVLAGSGQGAPASVMEPYQAYMQAWEANDVRAASGWAETAYRAGVAEGIEPELLAALAENRATVLEDLGEHARAASAYADLSQARGQAGAERFEVAQALVQAAEIAMRAGEASTADRHAQDALRALGDGQELRERVERHRALTVRAMSEWDRARHRDAGRHAAGSLAALDGLNPPPTSDIGIMAFYAGVGDAIQRNHEDAAYHFTLSAAILDAAEPDSDNGMIARAWSRFSRSSLDDDGFASLLDRLAASDFSEFIVSPEDEDDEEEAERPEGWVDANLIRRSLPDYPPGAAYAGTNGLTLFRFAINEQGRTEDIEIMYAIPHPIFGEYGQRAIRRWRYTPATVNGVPVRREGVITQFAFTVEDD